MSRCAILCCVVQTEDNVGLRDRFCDSDVTAIRRCGLQSMFSEYFRSESERWPNWENKSSGRSVLAAFYLSLSGGDDGQVVSVIASVGLLVLWGSHDCT